MEKRQHQNVALGLTGQARYDAYRKHILRAVFQNKKMTRTELARELKMGPSAINNAYKARNSKLAKALDDLIEDQVIEWDGKYYCYVEGNDHEIVTGEDESPNAPQSVREALENLIMAVRDHVEAKGYGADYYAEIIMKQQKVIDRLTQAVEERDERLQGALDVESLLNIKTTA